MNISEDKIRKNKEACFEKLRVIFLQDLWTELAFLLRSLMFECVIYLCYVELRQLETDFSDGTVLTSKAIKRLFLYLRCQPKVNQLHLIICQIQQDIFRLEVAVYNTFFFACDVSFQDLSEVSSHFIFWQWVSCGVTVLYNVKKVFAGFWSFHNKTVMFFCEDELVDLDDVWVMHSTHQISLSRDLSSFQL